MKEEALALIKGVSAPSDKLNLLREYVQAMVLRSLHESEAFVNLCFVGGTALRFIHNLPRFSEELDFSVEHLAGYEPELWMNKVKSDLQFAGFDVSVSWNDRSTVHKSWIKIAGVLKEAGLAGVPEQKLSIKIEIDSNPPRGGVSEVGIINRHAMFALRYYNLPSAMAGRIHALITRKYAKGRDWYDLLWYRSRCPTVEPNLELLQNALDQTQGKDVFCSECWKALITKRFDALDSQVLIKDVQGFLERSEDAGLLTKENIESVLR